MGILKAEMPGGRKYRQVVANDQAVLEMSSIDPGPSSSSEIHQTSFKKIKVGGQANMDLDTREGSMPPNAGANGPHRESKLELFGFDSLVNILGLKSMTEEQIAAPSSPRDGEDITITDGRLKRNDLKLGTMMGVFVPCLQNIMGIIYYIRFSWIVGMAGIGESLLLVAFCGLCTFLTGISLSAIATNGAMKGGGPYYLISRALGPEVGVSIGLCFFLGNAVAGALYVLGAVETFLKAVPAAGIFRGTDKPSAGITGLSITSFKENWSPDYQTTNNAGIPDPDGKSYWNFNALVGLFFPAVTGIMAGSNRSALLKDTQRSIPIGTLAALYIISVFFFWSTCNQRKAFDGQATYSNSCMAFPGCCLHWNHPFNIRSRSSKLDRCELVLLPSGSSRCSQLASSLEVSPLEPLSSWSITLYSKPSAPEELVSNPPCILPAMGKAARKCSMPPKTC